MNEFDYTKKDIINSLKIIGLKSGDNVFVHSNIGFFGKLKDATGTYDYCKAFKDSLFKIIGTDGTLIVPTFSYSFCNNKFFNKSFTESKMGIFPEYIRKDSDSLRSDDPNFSISSIGKNAKKFTQNTSIHSFGIDSFWERFLNEDGKICNFNFGPGSTFIHYVEKVLRVPYRFDKSFSGWSQDGEKKVKKTFFHFVRDLNKIETEPDLKKFDKKAKELGFVKISNLGKGQITCISAKNTFELIKSELSDPEFLIKGSKK